MEQAIQNQKKRRADKATIGRKGTPKVHRFTMGRKGGPKLDRATIGVKGDKSHRAIIINDEMETVVRDTVEVRTILMLLESRWTTFCLLQNLSL